MQKYNNNFLTTDVEEFIKLLWKKKYFILIISILCSLITYFSIIFRTQEFITEIEIKNFSLQSSNYNSFDKKIIKLDDNNFNEIFLENFNKNLMSAINILSFIEENTKIDSFKNFLKKKTSAQDYLDKKKFIKLDSISKNYLFIFPIELEEDFFFSDYFQFIKKKTLNEFESSKQFAKYKNQLRSQITTMYISYKNKSSFFNQFIKNDDKKKSDLDVLVETIFAEELQLLLMRISETKELLMVLNSNRFDYNFDLNIIKKSTIPNHLYSFTSLGFLSGFFLSIIIISVANLLKK
jgi:hypothetical protein